MKKLITILLLGLFVNACSATTGSTVAGCAAGGVVGSKIGQGQGNTAAIIVGTVLGCKAGNEVAKQFTLNQ